MVPRPLLILLFVAATTNSYKILVYNSKFGHSHSSYLGRIADVLTEAGHNVTSIIPIIDEDVHDGTKLSKIIHVNRGEATVKRLQEIARAKEQMFSMSDYNPFDSRWFGNMMGSLFAGQCEAVLDDKVLIQQLKEEKFDVIIAEIFDMCGVGLVEVLRPNSFIAAASSPAVGPQQEEFGGPIGISYNPVIHRSTLDVHSTWDRAVNLYLNTVSYVGFGPTRSHMHNLFKRKYGDDFPEMHQIVSNSAYIFMNTEPLIDFAVPTLSKMVHIAGIAAKQPKKLSEDWEKILAKREKTILLSFGSVMLSHLLPMTMKMSIVQMIKALPDVTFIWKYEVDDEFTREIASKIDNIELTKWMPQVDILNHPNLSAFITHGGMGSTQECALSGVPGVFIPVFADQPRNAGMMQYNRLGNVLSRSDASDSSKFLAAVREVLEDESYRKNAQRTSAMLRKKPFTARDQLIKYTQFAAEFGASKAMRPQSHDMNFIEYHNLDIVFFGLIVLATLSISIFSILKTIASKLFRIVKIKIE